MSARSGPVKSSTATDCRRQWTDGRSDDHDLCTCGDLLDTDHTWRLSEFAKAYVASGSALPRNLGAKRLGGCFLINSFCEEVADEEAPIDTVRGVFLEGATIVELGGVREAMAKV